MADVASGLRSCACVLGVLLVASLAAPASAVPQLFTFAGQTTFTRDCIDGVFETGCETGPVGENIRYTVLVDLERLGERIVHDASDGTTITTVPATFFVDAIAEPVFLPIGGDPERNVTTQEHIGADLLLHDAFDVTNDTFGGHPLQVSSLHDIVGLPGATFTVGSQFQGHQFEFVHSIGAVTQKTRQIESALTLTEIHGVPEPDRMLLTAMSAMLLWVSRCIRRGPRQDAMLAGRTGTMRFVITLLLLVTVVVVGLPIESARAQAIINDAGMQLGINPEGHLNVGGGSPSESGSTVVGFRGGAKESIASDGWGVAIAGTRITGYASVGTDGGPHNLSVVSFTSDAGSAASVVNVIDPGSGLPVLRVTHDYHSYPPLPWWGGAGAFEATINIANISGAATAGNVLYRRVIDWNVEPTGSPQYVTLAAGITPSNVAFTSDDGFETANPLVNHMRDVGGCGFAGFFECGAAHHGALFDLSFAPLGPDEALTFHAYYLITSGQPRFRLSDLGAEVWTFSHAGPGYVCEAWDPFCDFGIGGPNFVLALNGVGGIPLVAEPGTLVLMAAGLLGLATMLRHRP